MKKVNFFCIIILGDTSCLRKGKLEMGLLRSAVKYKAAKKITNKALGDGVLSSVVAAKAVKKSNQRSNECRNKQS